MNDINILVAYTADDLSQGLPIQDLPLRSVMPDIGRRIGGELMDSIPLMRKAENEWLDLVGMECMRQVDNEAFETADVQTENNL